MRWKKIQLYISIAVVVILCLSIGIHVYKTLSDIDKKNLTSEFHELFWHTSKLQIDILNFKQALIDYEKQADDNSHEKLLQCFDLLVVRYGVISNLSSRVSIKDMRLPSELNNHIQSIDKILTSDHSDTAQYTNKIRSETEHLATTTKEFAYLNGAEVQKSIGNSAITLSYQAKKIALFLIILAIASIVVIVLIHRQATSNEQLRKLRNLLTNIIDSMPSVLICVDTSERVTQWNKAAEQSTGMSASEVYGKILYEVLPEMTDLKKSIKESILSKDIQQHIGKAVHTPAKTQPRYEDTTIFPLIANGVEGAVIRTDDVTEKYYLEEQLRHRGKMDAIGELAGGVAHDFNNMLSGIMGATEILAMQVGENPRGKKLLNMILDSAERASHLTQKLLTFAKKQQPASTAIDFNDTIKESVALLQSTLDRRIDISVELDARSSIIIGDPSQLQNALINLGINASHAMPTGGTISIRTENVDLDEIHCKKLNDEIESGEYLKVSFTDTGVGIAPRNLPRIFEPFFTTKEKSKGTGLGLAAVFGTIQQHHGAIVVNSEIDKGSTFQLFFPLCGEEPDDSVQLAEPVFGSGCILVIDDEPVMRGTAEAILISLGYEVLVAANGREGLELFKENCNKINLVVMDMIMPEMNGKDCFILMKEIAPDVKVVLSSGFSQEGDVTKMKELGLRGFIQKPFRSAKLSQLINDVLHS